MGCKASIGLFGIVCLLLASCTHQTQTHASQCDPDGAPETCRPFRTGFIKIDPELDAIKPLGSIDESGWSLAGSYLLGSPRKEWVAAYDLKNKKYAWWFPAKADLTAPVGVFGSWAILPLRDGRLVKVESQSGKVLWDVRLSRFLATRISLAGSSLLAYTVDQKLFSLDFQTGQTQWVFDAGTPSSLTMRSAAAPVASGNEVFLGNSDGQLFSISLASGKENWKIEVGKDDSRYRDIVGEIAVGNRQVYVTRLDGQVFAYGTVQKPSDALWQESYPTITASAYRDGTLYLASVNGDVSALQASNGRVLWKVGLGQAVKSITLGEKSIFLGGSEGRITALNNTDGRILWYDDLKGVLTQQPVVIDDQIYYSTGLKVIYSYKLF